MKKRLLFSAFSAAVLLASGILFTSCSSDGQDKENSIDSEADSDILAEVTEETPEEEYTPPVYVQCSKDEVHRGELILVNRDYAYDDVYDSSIVNIYANMSDSYNVNRSDMELNKDMINAINGMLDEFASVTGITNVLCNSGYRSYEEQKEMYYEDLEYTGMTVSDRVAPPGHSEHHTGYAMDFAVDDGYEYPALKNEGEYSWIYENAHRYGMILRYTEQNKHITGYMAESWHFRYIGPIHASLVRKMGVAYEEYIGFLKDFQFDNPLEYKHSDTEFYRIYYVPMNNDADVTEVPLPYEAFGSDGRKWEYTISGNNADGFIVTLKIPELSPDYDDTYLYMFNPSPDILTTYDSAEDSEDTDYDNAYDDSDDYSDDMTEEPDADSEEAGW